MFLCLLCSRDSAPQPTGAFLNYLKLEVTCFILFCFVFSLRVQCRGKRVLTSGPKTIVIQSTSMNITVKTRGARWGHTVRPSSSECARRGQVNGAQPHQTTLGKSGVSGAEPASPEAPLLLLCGVGVCSRGCGCSPGWPGPAVSRNPGQRDS